MSARPAELGIDEAAEAFYSGSFVSRSFRALAELRELWLVSDPYNRIHVSLALRELMASQTIQEEAGIYSAAIRILGHGLPTKGLKDELLQQLPVPRSMFHVDP